MFGPKTIRVIVLTAFTILAPQVFAQPKSDPQEKPRKVRREPHKAFTEWLKEVEPILTPEEVAAWKKLTSDEEREKFIEIVWRRRDPDPDTEENEYREAYFERLAYVNEHFSSGIPGYKTDRGKIYLKYGKPDEVEAHPSGGAYQREFTEGGGSTSTYPFERWWYRNLPGRSDIEIEFIDPTGSGEYRIARNPFEKEAMLNVPGAGATMDGTSQIDRLNASFGFGNPFSGSAKGSPWEWMDLLRLRDEAPKVNFDRPIGTGTGTPITDANLLSSDIQISFFRQSNQLVVVAFTIQTDNRDLVFRDIGGIQTARVNIAGRITTVADRRIGFFEDTVTTTATPAELVSAKERRSAYQKALPLMPGRYRIDLLVRDTESGAAAVQHVGFEVPKFGTELSSSSLILASVLQQVSDVPASHQFVIGDKKVIPNLTGTYHRGTPIGIYMQIYNAGIDQTTLRPAVDVEYVLLKDGSEVGKQVEDWRGNSDAGQRLTVARLLDSRTLKTGDYVIEVRVRDHINGKSLVQSAKFSILE